MSQDFFSRLPAFRRFDQVLEPGRYTALPDDWWLAVADIRGSTKAIEAGRYKAVNFVGAAPIAAVRNATAERDVPFVFGGDGSMIAVPAGARRTAEIALAATARWARQNFDIDLRVGMVSLAAVRKAGHDIRVARFQASDNVSYAMIDGGGAAWAEDALKQGHLDAPEPADDRPPDLSDLSCRWQPMDSRRGVMVSLIVEPVPDADRGAVNRVLFDVLSMVDGLADHGSPVPELGPGFRWPPPDAAVDLEARATAPGDASATDPDGVAKARKSILKITRIARLMQILNIRLGGFDARRYRRVTGQNADFRKFDDGLRLTIDCAPGDADRLDAHLSQAAERGLVRYGLHRQDQAIMTCIVPDPRQDTHVHFVDGADGGYAVAAKALKGQ